MINRLLRRWLLRDDRDPPPLWLRPDQRFPAQTILALRKSDGELLAEFRANVRANEIKRRQRKHVEGLVREADFSVFLRKQGT